MTLRGHEKARADSLAEQLAAAFSDLDLTDVPAAAVKSAVNDLLDMAGLCIAARGSEYIASLLASWDSVGECTALGHARPLDAAGAALINGTATHGEDFDDTLEGAPIRVGAMVIPAVLAACERFDRSGADCLKGLIVGLETICRLNHIAPGAIHKANFHPVGVIGPFGAAAGVATALGLSAREFTMALGIAGSFSSGIIEFLTDGAWTKRLHPGWAAQSGYRAALMARGGFFGPRTVFDGEHNFFKAFAPTAQPMYEKALAGLGETWLMERIAFKPYACGTMIHPYIDCMLRLRESGVVADDIIEIECPTGEGLVHRLWEPLAAKHRPRSGYAAKFSMPFCMAVAFFDGDAGLEQFTDERVRDTEVLALAAKIRYVIDPDDPYPDNYTGTLHVQLRDGRRLEYHQPHMRGGWREPLDRDALVAKFRANIRYGNWPEELGERLLDTCLGIAEVRSMRSLAAFRT